ncbi:MAG TPA: hypothetical protein VIV63_00260, partial [Steroidobacteraceae bacterium]
MLSRIARACSLGLAIAVSSSAFAQSSPSDWGDIEGRIQYAYYTNDARALNSVLASLKPHLAEGETETGEGAVIRAYFRALTHYRLAQVLSSTKKGDAKDAIDECG